MSVIDVAVWVATTGQRLIGSWISNIYRDGEKIHIKIKQPGENPVLVYAEPGSRIHITRIPRRSSKEFKSDSLQATLRKYLRNRVVEEIEQVGFDRIVRIRGGSYSLIVELLNRGTLVLLDPEDKVIVSLRYIQMRDRSIKPKHKYVPPPSKTRNPLQLSAEDISKVLEKANDLVRGIVRGLGLPGDFAEEALYRAGFMPETPSAKVQQSDLENIRKSIHHLFKEALEGRGYLVYKDGSPYQATSFAPTFYQEQGYRVEEFETLDEALDNLFSSIQPGTRESRLEKLIQEETARVRASITKHHETIMEYEKKAVELREKANWIAMHYQLLEEILACVWSKKETSGWSGVQQCPHIETVHPRLGRIEVEINGVRVSLDIRKNLDQLLRELYKRAGELEGKAKRARRIVDELEAKLDEAVRKAKLRYAREILSRRPRDWYEKFHWTLTPSNMLVIAGRNIDQNESIVRKHMEEHDIFLHAVIHGAPATVLKTGGMEPGEQDIREAAQIAASYSRAWNAGAGYVDVFWVHATQVSKSPPSGEYLAKGSFMVYGNKNYVRGVQLRLYLGIEPLGRHLRVIVGTRENVSDRSILYVGLQPGSMKKEEAAMRIKERLKTKAKGDEAVIIEAIPDEWIIERLPGRVQIVEWSRGKVDFNVSEFFSS